MRVMGSKPRFPHYLEFYWTAYQRLSSCRPHGPTAMGLIPWSAMDQYCRRFDIHGSEYDGFMTIIEYLDQADLAYQAERAKNKSKSRGK